MKRILLAAICAALLLFTGCTAINQSNTFVVMPTDATTAPDITAMPEDTIPPDMPDVTAIPEFTAAPDSTLPMGPLEVQPTVEPDAMEAPVASPTPTPQPEGNPGSGFNG